MENVLSSVLTQMKEKLLEMESLVETQKAGSFALFFSAGRMHELNSWIIMIEDILKQENQ